MSSAAVVARNSVFGVLALAIDKAVFMVVVLVLARYLGTVDFGRYAFITAYIGVFGFVADLGVEMILTRRISQHPEERDRLLSNGLTLRLAMGVACWAAALVLVPVVADASYVALTAIGGIALVGNTWMTYKALYRSLMRIEYLLLLIGFNAIASAAYVAVVVFCHAGVRGSVLAISAGSASTLPLSMWLSRGFFKFHLKYEPQLWRGLLREALPLGVNAVLVSVALRIGPILLIRLSGPAEVAFFTAASKLVEAFCLIPEVPMLTIFPLMAAALRDDKPERLAALTRTATKWVVVLLLPLVLLASGVAEPLMLLMYGQAFEPARDVLRVLVWATAFSATGVVWIGVLTTLGLQRFLMWFYGLATAVNLTLGFILIPSFGAIGAGAAAVLAAAVSQALLLWLPETARYLRPAFLGVIPAFLITFALAAALPRLPLSPLPATAVCLLLYVVAVVSVGTIGREERALALRLIGNRGRG